MGNYLDQKSNGFETITMPVAMSSAQSIYEASTNEIYVIGSSNQSAIHCFHNHIKQYSSLAIAPSYTTVNLQPNNHCIIPLVKDHVENTTDSTIKAIVSINGWMYPHFSVLKNTRKGYRWNTAHDEYYRKLLYPVIGHSIRALNINNNIHYIYDSDPQYRECNDRYLVYLPNGKHPFKYYPNPPFNPKPNGFGLARLDNRIIILNSSEKREIAYLDLTKNEMIGEDETLSEEKSNADYNGLMEMWKYAFHKMPFEHPLIHFDTASIGYGLLLIVGGTNCDTLNKCAKIYIFDATFINHRYNDCFMQSQITLPKPLSHVNCVIVGDNSELHIIGGVDSKGDKVDTHYWIDLKTVVPKRYHNRIWNRLPTLIDAWMRGFETRLPLEITNLVSQFCNEEILPVSPPTPKALETENDHNNFFGFIDHF